MMLQVKDGDEYYLQTNDYVQKLTIEKNGTCQVYFSDEIIGIDLYCWPCIEGFGVQHSFETPKDCLKRLIEDYVDDKNVIQYVNEGKSNLDIKFVAGKWELWKHNTATVVERDKVAEYVKVSTSPRKDLLEEFFVNNLWNTHLINILLEYASICVVPLYKYRNTSASDTSFTVMKLSDEEVDQTGYVVCDLESMGFVGDIEDFQTFLYWIDMEIDGSYVSEEADTFSYTLEEELNNNTYSLIDYQEGFVGDDPEENGMIELLGDEWIYAEKIPELLSELTD